MANNTQLQTRGLQQLKGILANDTMKKNFENILKENSGAFMASIIELYQSDASLQMCDPNKVILEALKAATLKLPINKQLGFAYIIPYKNKGASIPQFQLGYKGYIQLAQRSGQYRYINADIIYEGEIVKYNRVTGMLEIAGEATSDKAIGYFAYFQLLNGFEKAVYWTTEKVTAHARKYSKSYSSPTSVWHTNFDAMALKTVIKNIISKYGVMSVEFANAVANDTDDSVENEVNQNANKAPIVLPETPVEDTPDIQPDPDVIVDPADDDSMDSEPSF